MRQIDLGLDFFFAAWRFSGSSGGRLRFAGGAEVNAYLLCFVLFQRTGMRLLLSHPDHWQHVENSSAFDFQLPGEIVDSNLTHPAFRYLRAVLKSSSRPHGVNWFPHKIEDSAGLLFIFPCSIFRSNALFCGLLTFWLTGDRLGLG
jgi:hypothetical protein